MAQCCGVCMYSKNRDKYPDGTKSECMLDGYQPHELSYLCDKFKRDFQKNAVIRSVKIVKK